MSDANQESAPARRASKLPFDLQFSLVELLAILLFAGLGAAALRTGGWVAFAFLQVAMWGTIALALSVMAAPASSAWRAFVLGFVLGLAGYVGPALYVGESELDPYTAKLPLTRTLKPVWEAVQRPIYVDPATGDEFEADEVTPVNSGGGYSGPFPAGSFGVGGGMMPGGNGTASGFTFYAGMPYQAVAYVTADGRGVNQEERPPRYEFMLVAHALLAIAIGYVFGKFATIVYRRRKRRETPSSVDGLNAASSTAEHA